MHTGLHCTSVPHVRNVSILKQQWKKEFTGKDFEMDEKNENKIYFQASQKLMLQNISWVK